MNSEKVIQGRKNRARGLEFERKVRLDLENDGWIVSKWQNNVSFGLDFVKGQIEPIVEGIGKCIPAKMGRYRTNQNGFPDFICYKHKGKDLYKVVFVEVKINGYLSKEEKEKAIWYLNNKYCSEFFVASLLNKKINYKKCLSLKN